MKNFAVLGVSGFIAPRHLEAIHKNGGRIVATLDPNDSVGIIDKYGLDIPFFKSTQKFETFVKQLKGSSNQVDYFSICSPNHFHNEHVQMGLKLGIDVICEKPLVVTTTELKELKLVELEYKKKVNVILQLRLHDKIVRLKNDFENQGRQQIQLNYVTARGPWYFESWKGDIKKSGGLSTNIGIHFFDMLTWIWGSMKSLTVNNQTPKKASGILTLEHADVNWMLSIDVNDVPQELREKGQRTYRSIKINSQEFDFSEGFTDLHAHTYHKILSNEGFGISDVEEATKITELIRECQI